MLKRLVTKNYKCLVDFEMRFEDIALLLGTNGTGKSAILDVVYGIKQFLVGKLPVAHQDAFPANTLPGWLTRDTQTFCLDVELDGALFQYQLGVQHHRDTGRAHVLFESLKRNNGLLFQCIKGEARLYRDDHSEGPMLSVDSEESFLAKVSAGRDNKRLARFVDFVRSLVVCRLNPSEFEPTASGDSPELERDGRNFAAWYRHLMQQLPEQTNVIVSELRTVIDGFHGLVMDKASSDTRTMQVVFASNTDRYPLHLHEVSDGQRILLVLYTLLGLAAYRPFTLLIDEPDNFLALSEIQPWAMALADACADSGHQAVICSHHPELIDYFGADKGILLERTEEGTTTVRSASDIRAKDGLRLSEHVARGWLEANAGDVP